ncbi:response regulator [Metapseudomonas resinovorans]|uniref:response regulator n=1 Tax=Metapseudomonas resinovorans TaxID=53412 RepID=UPI00048C7F69|nr:response regulator [Pseudomonas resinovorans]
MNEFSVLIVEDSEAKLHSIQTVLERVVKGLNLTTAKSVRSAIDAIQCFDLDMIIADMSLPTYDVEVRERGGTPRPFGGIEVFETLERFSINVPVLVVTSYPVIIEGSQNVGLSELSLRLKNEFPESFIGTVYFDSSFSYWEKEIEGYVTDILRGKYGS